jgi:uncharacterized phage protein gp47/JayE
LTEIVAAIRSNLAQSDPELDTNVGTVSRKIIDAVAESVSEAYIDSHMLSYQYDIDTKGGSDLDSFCALFGIYRLAARRASGTVTFSRTGALTTTAFIPVNTQINSITSPIRTYLTLVGGIMVPGDSTVNVPVQAIVAGPESNLGPGLLNRFASPLSGIGSVTNLEAITGGEIQETDSELRARFKATVFRSLAGTEQMYLGIALAEPECEAANVLGSSKRRREQLQIATGNAVTTVPDAAYVYPNGVFVGENIDAGEIAQRGYDYDWDTTVNPPEINVVNAAALPDDMIVEVDFEYTPTSSRNDPLNGIVHKVDVWCAGSAPVTAVQSVIFRGSRTFNNTPGDPLYRQDFVRLIDGTPPSNANVFIPLAYGPIVSVPDTLDIGPDSYGLVDSGAVCDFPDAYQIVHRDGADGWAANSKFGLEFDNLNLPANGEPFVVGNNDSYVYNAIPGRVQDGIDRWRLLGIDALAHAAKTLKLRFNFAVMYDRGQLPATVDSSIDTALATFVGSLGIGGALQTSDILRTVANVNGVDAVRFRSGVEDEVTYTYGTRNNFDIGIQLLVDGVVVETYVTNAGWAMDLFFGDDEFPVFTDAIKELKAANTFGVA